MTAVETTTAKKTVRGKKPNQPVFLNCIYTQLYFNLFTIYFIFLHFRFHHLHCTFHKVRGFFIGHWSLLSFISLDILLITPTHQLLCAIILWLYHQESHTYRNHKYCNRDARNYSHADDACVVALHLAHPLALLPLLHRLVRGLDLQRRLLSCVGILKSANPWEWGKQFLILKAWKLQLPLGTFGKEPVFFHFAK